MQYSTSFLYCIKSFSINFVNKLGIRNRSLCTHVSSLAIYRCWTPIYSRRDYGIPEWKNEGLMLVARFRIWETVQFVFYPLRVRTKMRKTSGTIFSRFWEFVDEVYVHRKAKSQLQMRTRISSSNHNNLRAIFCNVSNNFSSIPCNGG